MKIKNWKGNETKLTRRKESESGGESIRKIKQCFREVREKAREMRKNDDKGKTRERRRSKEVRGMGEKREEKMF